MRRSTKPRVPVILSDLEIHWLITHHDLNIHEALDPGMAWGKEWSESRRLALLEAWDQSKQSRQELANGKAGRAPQAPGDPE